MKQKVNKLSAAIRRKFGSISRFAKTIGVPVNDVYASFAKIRMNSGKYVTKFDSKKELEKWQELFKSTKS